MGMDPQPGNWCGLVLWDLVTQLLLSQGGPQKACGTERRGPVLIQGYCPTHLHPWVQ